MVASLYRSLLFLISILEFTSAINLLSSTPAAVDGILSVCPRDSFSLTCSHTNTDVPVTRWIISTSDLCAIFYDDTSTPNCSPFTVSMISDSSSSSLNSTIEANGFNVRDIPFIICQAGVSSSKILVGNISLKVIDSPPSVPEIGPIEYSVGSAITGKAKFTVHSQGSLGSPVTYTGSVVEGSGSVEVTDNLITVTGLDYTQPHMVTVVAANNYSCPMVGTSNTTVPLSFNIAAPLLSPLNISIMCSFSSLPIRVSWTVSPGVQVGFTTASYDVPTNVDQSSVNSSNTCVTVMLSKECYDNIVNGGFSVQLQYAFGVCKNLLKANYTTSSVKILQYSTCLPVNRGSNDFCYRATLLYQQATGKEKVIDVATNLNFNFCSIAKLRSILSDGVTFDLDGLDSNTSVPHLTTATLSCVSTNMALEGLPNTSCHNGAWSSTELGSCLNITSMRVADWQIGVIILIILLVVYLMGTVCGLVVGHHWQKLTEALTIKQTWAIVVIIVLSFTFGLGFGITIHYLYRQNCEKCKSGKNKQTKGSYPPPPNSLYADLNTIEHQTTPTGAEYALVGVKVGQKEKVIQHETAPSGDAYALIDKMKTEKEQPDVVPPTVKKELSYTEVDINTTSTNSKPSPDQDLSTEYATIEQMLEKSS